LEISLKITILRRMKNKAVFIICLIIYIITALAGLLFAGMYLFRPEFMPYHEVAVGMPWHEVPAEFRILIIALLRVSGGGWLATSVGISVLTVYLLRGGGYRAHYALQAIALSALVPTFIATLYVRQNTTANPPYLLAGVLIGLMVVVIMLVQIYKQKQ
jgi:hypothetical protein